MSRVQPEPQTNRGHPRFCPDTVLPLGLAAAGKRAAAGAEGHGRTLTVAQPRPRPHQARPLRARPLPGPTSRVPSHWPRPAAAPPRRLSRPGATQPYQTLPGPILLRSSSCWSWCGLLCQGRASVPHPHPRTQALPRGPRSGPT